ncbi:beta-1,6-N-acetylglucosaminyltransferase [Aeromonas veronii]
MILAHNNPRHLERLVDKLRHSNCQIFIHIDKASDIEQFKRITYSNVEFVKNRVSVYWGGFSLTQATLNLLEYAINKTDCHRFQLLSGVDYPIKPISKLESFLSNNDKMEFITLNSIIDEQSALFFRISRPHLIDSKVTNPKTRGDYIYIKSEVDELVNSVLESTIKKLHLERIDNLTRKFRIYKGSNWFNLSREAAQYCIDFIKYNNDFLDAFRFTECSDEMFFHTIIGNSRFCERVCKNFEHKKANAEHKLFSGLHYVNWNSRPAPKTFTEIEELDELVSSQAFFARKFNEQSLDVLDAIDLKILNLS